MKILFATSSLFPYRSDWLNELGKQVEITIFYLVNKDSARNREWMNKRPESCHYIFMKGLKLPFIGKISFSLIRHLKKNSNKYDIIILDGYGFSTQIINILYLNLNKYKYFVNIDGMVPKDKENNFLRFFKKIIIRRIPYCLCGSKSTNLILNNYGLPSNRIINHPFTSLFERDIFQNTPTEIEKKFLREKNNIKEEKVIISMGRFSYKKG